MNGSEDEWGNGLVRCNNEYPLTDGRVNVRLTTNASQAITSASQPDSFGVNSVTSGTASAYGYGGAVGYREEGLSPAGLSTAYAFQKVGARYYDQAFGCFLTRDTDLSQKPYAYCDGDPVNCTDPSGHWVINIAHPGPDINSAPTGSAADGWNTSFGSSQGSSSSSSSNGLHGTGTVTASTTQQGSTTTNSLGVTINLGRTTLTNTLTETTSPIHTSLGDVAGIGYNFGGGLSISGTYAPPTGGKPASGTLKIIIPFKF